MADRKRMLPRSTLVLGTLIAVLACAAVAPLGAQAPADPSAQTPGAADPAPPAPPSQPDAAGLAEDAGAHAAATQHPSAALPLWSVIPFVLMLLSIAVLPLAAPHWWESNLHKLLVSAALAIPMVLYLLRTVGFVPLEHALIEYGQFIILLGSLYVISGGIVVTGDIQATPRNNVVFLFLGGALASFIGTTGASMLLIRPLLATNSERHNVVHTVIFFIFIVSNCGGCLTPLGDPPLFLGYLRGVPFAWTFSLWPEWLGINGALLVLYWIWDNRAYRKETIRDVVLDRTSIRPIRTRGTVNLVLLLGVIACVAFVPSVDTEAHQYVPWRELGMLALCALSFVLTAAEHRATNQFTFHAINEVAALFIGIFITMVPALLLLQAYGPGLGVDSPVEFFWYTGLLSSFLDNAPTYATFFELGKSVTASHPELAANTVAGVYQPFLTAISLGAVFMGAVTYIGNGPNFMVKSIAESRGVKMPTFFGYMLYSIGILIPLMILQTYLVFFRPTP
jgi:Na+/H+ antiporter NhaD/arsenite permease-like protein